MRRVAIFDFDKTLTMKDTLMPLAFHVSKAKKRKRDFYFLFGYYLLFRCKLISDKEFKNIFLRIIFDGYLIENVQNLIEGFEHEFVIKNLNSPVYSELKRYLANGYRVIVISSNLKIMLSNLKLLKPVVIIATEVGYNSTDRCYTIKGNPCKDLEKLRRLETTFGKKIYKQAIFYGDKEDALLLRTFKNSIHV